MSTCSEAKNKDLGPAICKLLKENHIGKENAVHSKELEQMFSVGGRTIRNYISALRRDKVPICSNENGYYYAENQKEINATVIRLNSLERGISNARTGMLRAKLQKSEPILLSISIKIER